MNFIEAVVALVGTMTLLPFLAHADSMDFTNSSLPYCNRTDDHPMITTSEVCLAAFNAMNEIEDLCMQGGLQCTVLPKKQVTIGTNITVINDQVNAKLEFLLGRLQKVNELCEIEEEKLFSGEESLNPVCNVIKCQTKNIIKLITQYLLEQKCGCTEGCNYAPGRYIELNQDTTVIQLLDILHGDFGFLYCVFYRTIMVSTSPDPQPGPCADVTI